MASCGGKFLSTYDLKDRFDCIAIGSEDLRP